MSSGVGPSNYNRRELAVIQHLLDHPAKLSLSWSTYNTQSDFTKVLNTALDNKPLKPRNEYLKNIRAKIGGYTWGYFLWLRLISGRYSTTPK